MITYVPPVFCSTLGSNSGSYIVYFSYVSLVFLRTERAPQSSLLFHNLGPSNDSWEISPRFMFKCDFTWYSLMIILNLCIFIRTLQKRYCVFLHAPCIWHHVLVALMWTLLFSHSVASDPVGCSTPGFPVLHHLPELAKLMPIGSVMPSSHLILCRPLLFPPSTFPSIRVFSKGTTWLWWYLLVFLTVKLLLFTL